MTPKQALNNIRYHYFNGNREYNDLDTEWSWFERIEQALKVLEIIKDNFEISKPVGIDVKQNKVNCGSLIQKKDLMIQQYHLLNETLYQRKEDEDD